MKKIKNEYHWRKCGLCSKSIKNNEECFEIQYKKQLNRWASRYVREYWHLRHFVFRDYSAACDKKMECATSDCNSRDLGCEKKLCEHYRGI